MLVAVATDDGASRPFARLLEPPKQELASKRSRFRFLVGLPRNGKTILGSGDAKHRSAALQVLLAVLQRREHDGNRVFHGGSVLELHLITSFLVGEPQLERLDVRARTLGDLPQR